MSSYVHGYSLREAERLADQATTLRDLLHHDTFYAAGERVLEVGCGTGAQTIALTEGSPKARIVSEDISLESLEQARLRAPRAMFAAADILRLPFPDGAFDHVFVCFVLEHLRDPASALQAFLRVLRPGGSITVIEGDHGSWYCHPQTREASEAVQCLIEIQARMGGDSLIGRRLYPLLVEGGIESVAVSPRMVYVDASRPELVEGFSKNTFNAMVEGVGEQALAMGLTTPDKWRKGLADLHRATEADGTFCYTFFKATGRKSMGRPPRPQPAP
jgi:SAM-dependent methyltransferase